MNGFCGSFSIFSSARFLITHDESQLYAALAFPLAGLMFDFFDGKGVVESLARELALPKFRVKALSAEEAPHLQPGRAAQVHIDAAGLQVPSGVGPVRTTRMFTQRIAARHLNTHR